MALPTLDRARAETVRTLRRFPLVIGSGVTAALAGIVASWYDADAGEVSSRLMAVALLGLPTFTALALAGERYGRRWIWDGAGTLGLAAFFLLWPGFVEPIPTMRYVQLSLAAHLAVAFLPVRRIGDTGFWQYNRSVLLRLLIAVVFSGALFTGLSIALVAIDNLLGVSIDDDTYGRLWLAVAFVFNTWFFLAGVPRDLAECDRETGYPVGLKVFAQFILAPIVAVYLLILTVYLGKIIVTTEWPSGWIGWLVSSVAAAGTLSLLLLYPASREPDNAWVAHFARWFHVAMLPSIAMLLLSIGKRIGQYGITERRYFVVVLAVWFAGIAVYHVLTRRETLRLIPTSLAILALVTTVGPWGAYSVSRRSQIHRLAGWLTANGMLVDGSIRDATGPVPAEDAREISAGFRYLLSTHDTTGWSGWFGDRLAAIDTTDAGLPRRRWAGDRRAEAIVTALGLPYYPRYGNPFEWQSVTLEGTAVPVQGYDYFLSISQVRDRPFQLDGTTWRGNVNTAGERITLRRGDSTIVTINLAPLLANLRSGMAVGRWKSTRIPAAALRLEVEREDISVRVQLNEASWHTSGDSTETQSFGGWIFLRMGAR